MWSALLSAILIVNELMASNAGEAMSPATNFDSWIELFNPSDQDVNLSGMYLSNSLDNPKLWQMPDDIGSVPAQGFMVVWLGSNNIKNNQAPFKLDCDGGTIYLSDSDGQLIVSQDYPEAMSRTAYARKTDGSGEWGWTATATPGATNATAVFADNRLPEPIVDQGSQLFKGNLNIKVEIPAGSTLMYTTDGSIPASPVSDSYQEPSWISLIENGTCEGTDATCLVSRDGNSKEDENRIVDGAGYDKSRGIRVHAISNPANDWDTQFFVYAPDKTLHAGDRYRFSMMARADKASHISAQTHTVPHDYIHWSMFDGAGFDITTTWQEYSFEGVITQEQAGASGMQTIAFNLNEKRQDNNFYFDNIVWELYFDPNTSGSDTGRQSKDGLFTINKTTNFVFRLFQDGWLPSVPVTRSYIKTNDNYTIPVISIVGNEKYFTDPMWGIDIVGKNGTTGNGRDYDPANWNMDWDRPVNFSYISPTEGMLFNQDVNISVSGGWTRQIDPRSMKLKSSKIFDGQNRFNYSFFPQKPYIRNKALVIRNGGNDVWQSHARFMDPALTTIVQRSGIDLDVQSTVQVAEYINGKFRGILNLREPNNDKFVYANYGYDDEEIDMFENGVFKNGTDEAFSQLCELAKRVNDPLVYEEIKELLDIDEFSNYMAAELFLGNDDWPINNIKAYRSQQDGRYRFVLFDLDYSFWPWGTKNSFSQIVDDNKDVDVIALFMNLLKHEEYRKKFIDTFCIMAGSVFEKQRASAIVDELATAMRPMSRLDGYLPDNAANTIKTMLKTQLTTMTNLLQQYKPLNLTNAKKLNVALNADTDGANLYINGLHIPYADFDGYLFAPATVEAKAPAGYTFAGWKKTSSDGIISDNPVIDLTSDGGKLSLIACFTPLSKEAQSTQGTRPVCINEVSAANGIYVNEYFQRNDWIELYNTTSQPIDIEGMYLSDNEDKPKKYQISKGTTKAETTIPAHGFMVVWCDKLAPQSLLHANFKLSADGGIVMLTAADESWHDKLTYTGLAGDQTAGRYPDGAQDVFVMNIPTIDKSNICSSYLTTVPQPHETGIRDLLATQESIGISYHIGSLIVRSTMAEELHLKIVNLAGQTFMNTPVMPGNGYAEISTGQLPAGVYIASITDKHGHKASCKFIVNTTL